MDNKENDPIIIGLMKIMGCTYEEAKKEFKRMYYPKGFLEDEEVVLNDMETPGR